MSEIEKMYKNAGIEPIAEYCKHQCNNEFDDNACIGCKYIEKVEYPPFTAEKQIELIKFLFNQGVYYSTFPNGTYQFHISDDIENPQPRKFDIAIAEIINDLWQSLTSEERKQIKEILE